MSVKSMWMTWLRVFGRAESKGGTLPEFLRPQQRYTVQALNPKHQNAQSPCSLSIFIHIYIYKLTTPPQDLRLQVSRTQKRSKTPKSGCQKAQTKKKKKTKKKHYSETLGQVKPKQPKPTKPKPKKNPKTENNKTKKQKQKHKKKKKKKKKTLFSNS